MLLIRPKSDESVSLPGAKGLAVVDMKCYLWSTFHILL